MNSFSKSIGKQPRSRANARWHFSPLFTHVGVPVLEFLHEIRKAIVPIENIWVAMQIELRALLHQVLGQDVIGHQSELELRAIPCLQALSI